MDNLPLVHKRWTCHCCPDQIDLKQQNISRKRFPIFDLNYWSDQGSSERRRPGFLKHTDVLVLVYGRIVVGEQRSEIKNRRLRTEARNLQDGGDVWSSQGPRVGLVGRKSLKTHSYINIFRSCLYFFGNLFIKIFPVLFILFQMGWNSALIDSR